MRDRPIGAVMERLPLVGRLEELEALERAYTGGRRLITLWGAGGTGKSRLLRHFAATLLSTGRASGGELFCDLTDARDGLDVVRSVGTALRLRRSEHDTDEDRMAVAEALAHRGDPLVLIDSFDRVVPHARETVGLWLSHAPRARFIITSRQPLRLAEEQRLEVSPLSEEEAIDLFKAAARQVRASEIESTTARQIVRRLDGLPLAIELAAARLEVLSPKELLERLQKPLEVLQRPRWERGDRHSTLASTVEWSWELLHIDDQKVLAACSVFRGGFTTPFAESLIEGELQETRALECLESLRLRSLMQTAEMKDGGLRLSLYEAVRLFASDRLEALGLRAVVERRHADVVLAASETMAPEHSSTFGPELLDALVVESDNLLAIHERFIDGDPALAIRAALLLHPLFLLRGPFDYHMALIGNVDEEVVAGLPSPLRTRLLVARGELLRERGRLDEARPMLEEALHLAQMDGDGVSRVAALRLLGSVCRTEGHLQEALRSLRDALNQSRKLSDEVAEAICLGEIGASLSALGRFREACRHHRMALELHRRLGDRRFEGIQLSYLGVATHRLGRIEEARSLHHEALEIHRELGNRRYEGAELSHLGYVHHQLGEHEAASEDFEKALRVCREVGDRGLEAIVLCYLGNLETDAGKLVSASSHLHDALLHFERATDRSRQAIASLHLGLQHYAADEPDEALHAFRAAATRASQEQPWIRAAAHAHSAALLDRIGRTDEVSGEGNSALDIVASIENPHQRLAVRLLCGLRPHEELEGFDEAMRCSSDVRRALRWTSADSTNQPIEVGPGSTWFRFDEGRVDLSRRRTLRLVLDALVKARFDHESRGLQWHELFEAGWPGEQISGEAALQRVYTAVWTLRKLGLRETLQKGEEGYRIDSDTPIVRRTDWLDT